MNDAQQVGLGPGRQPSLRTRMLWRVLVPLALTWLLGSAVAIGVATAFTSRAFDRALLDDAYAIAANVVSRSGVPVLSLSPRELSAVLFDQSESVFFSVLADDGTLISGNAGLRVDRPLKGAAPEFADKFYNGRGLRVVAVRREQPVPFVVVVGHTTRARGDLLQRLLFASISPQIVLLLLLGWWLRQSIGRDLEPLRSLQVALAERHSSDLTPVEVQAETRDLAQLKHSVNGLMARIDRGIQAQREFAGNVAHELRTPLAGIRALADYGLAHRDPAVWEAQLRSIAKSQERASHLVDQLLALALADEARDNLPLQTLRMDEVVRDVILAFLPRADADGVDLGAVGLDVAVLARGRMELVEGLLNNLIDNALRHGRPVDGAPARITVELRPQLDEVVCSVTDNGAGMRPEDAQRLLARWSQGAEGMGLGEGSGLGLAIASRYAVLLGGSLSLAPGPEGTGLCASFALAMA